jgi:hypothetical protein
MSTAHMQPQLISPSPITGEAINRGEYVKFNGSGLIVAAGAGERGIGFAMADAASGQPVSIAMWGGGAVGIAAGAISAGDYLKANADGHLVATTTGGDITVAIAMADGADNDVIPVLPICPNSYV